MVLSGKGHEQASGRGKKMSFNFTRVVGTQAQTRKPTRLDTEVHALTSGSNEEREGKEKREMDRDPAARPASVGGSVGAASPSSQ